MKSVLHDIGFLLVFMLACTHPAKVVEPVETPSSPVLVEIDSLMWQRPDSAFAMLQEFASSAAADNLDEFNGHYCQLLISELLYKNNYAQTNREDLMKAVDYFDNSDNAFLSARAYYMNGVGYVEKDSVVEACAEYLKTLKIMETHLRPNHFHRFMALTYSRIGELFASQFMQEPAIAYFKKSFIFDNIEPCSPNNQSCLLLFIGKQYYKLNQSDSAEYYFDEALRQLHDTNNAVFRDLVSYKALLDYDIRHHVEAPIIDLKRMIAQASDENELMARYTTLGVIYSLEGQYDSALFYLTSVFENSNDVVRQRAVSPYLRTIYQNMGDSLKADQYAVFIADNEGTEGENKAKVSQLNELFQQHQQWEQERADAERLGKARVRRNRMIVATGILVVLATFTAWLLHRRKMKAEREAHRLEKASMSDRLKKSNQEVRELKDQIKRQEEVNAKPQQAESFTDEPICRLIMEWVREGQFKAQMDCKLYKDSALGKEQVLALRDAADLHFNLFTVRLAKAYPNLTKNDLDYCCLYLLGLSDADISALMQRAYTTVNDRGRKMKAIFGTEEPLSATLRGFAEGSTGD